MSYFSRQNPFTRPTTLLPHQSNLTSTPPTYHNTTQNKKSAVLIVNKPKIDNPFQKSRFDSVFDRKKYQSQNKAINQTYNYEGTYIPLSRYENRIKLKEIDQENWKREKDKQQRYKLEHYGSEALRYSSFSTSHTSNYNNNPPSPKFVSKTNKQIKQQKNSRYRTEEQNPRSQYMLKYEKRQQKPKNKNNEGFQNNSSKNYSTKNLFYRNTPIDSLENLQSSSNAQSFNDNRQKDNYQNNTQTKYQQSGRYDRNLYVNNKTQYKKPQKLNDEFKNSKLKWQLGENIPNSKHQEYFQDQRKLERKITGSFSNQKAKEFMQSSFKKKDQQQHYDVRNSDDKSVKSSQSSENLIPDKPSYPSVSKQMSYNSNFQKSKQNFYDSDYINQDQETQRKGPLNAMKFSSSSFESDMFQSQKARLSRFGNTSKSKRAPSSKIQYDGRQYYLLKLGN